MTLFLTILHIITAILLIVAVLLQAGKGAEVGATFAGSSNTLFGASGAAPFMAKLTGWLAAVFMVASLGITLYETKARRKSVFDGAAAPIVTPQTPAEPTSQPTPATTP